MLQILKNVEIAPSAPILTGADGTTQIPPIFSNELMEDEPKGEGAAAAQNQPQD